MSEASLEERGFRCEKHEPDPDPREEKHLRDDDADPDARAGRAAAGRRGPAGYPEEPQEPRRIQAGLERTTVEFALLTDAEIDWYVASGEPRDKAGAYAVQGIGAMFIDSIHGSYTNVVGLPLATLFQMLRKAGIDPLAE